MYYNYHATAKRLIKENKLMNFYFTKNHNGIRPALVLVFNDLTLDRDTFELIKDEHRITLGKKEFGILEVLMLNAGKTIDKERLIEKIWGYDTNAEYNTIEVYISFIRRKIEALNSNTEIKAIRGLGYMLGEKK